MTIKIDSLSEIEQQVLSRISAAEWLSLTQEMVGIGQPNSTNPLDPDVPAGEEEAIALFVAGKLETLGFTVKKHQSQPRRPNIVGVLTGTGNGPSLMLNDHLDTYPAAEPDRWDRCDGDPFAATRHGDWLYGRGTSDTRGNLAASLLAVKAIVDQGLKLKGDLVCCYTVDEEKDGLHGSIYLTKTIGIYTDYAITAEPTAWGGDDSRWGMNISVANSGHCLLEVTIEGIKSHIWRPDTGINAIGLAARLVEPLHNMTFQHQTAKLPGHTPPSNCIVRIQGGLRGEMQFSPDNCTMTIAVVGILPGMTIDSIIADITHTINQHLPKNCDFAIPFTVRPLPGALFVKASEEVPITEEPNLSLALSYQKILGEAPKINRKNAFNDTIRFREVGINAVTFGPGEDGWSPINESISITKSVAATKIYALTIMNILGVEPPAEGA